MLIDRLLITNDEFWDSPLKVVLATAFICLVAPIQITEISYLPAALQIPITLQTLVILLVAAILGPKRGAIAAFAYVCLGLLGLPVFSNGSGGFDILLKPTGGFLVSFIVGAFLCGKMTRSETGASFLRILSAFFLSHLLILVIGFVWMNIRFDTDWFSIWQMISGLFWGVVIKSLLGAALVSLAQWGMRKLIRLKVADF
ncbi:biotin transporter BioY [Pontibacter sp. G13]|uniref:biotin transporter BioY n=1 Tax=Pontibacter sp. G13 TaxID=3074898 RepID=UPI00288AC73C|nr:biotin transporter BioY [Pontibacter sp. G13]WNJ21206.1 biotin transporter BioY [Pontibacter sp. G13]